MYVYLYACVYVLQELRRLSFARVTLLLDHTPFYDADAFLKSRVVDNGIAKCYSGGNRQML